MIINQNFLLNPFFKYSFFKILFLNIAMNPKNKKKLIPNFSNVSCTSWIFPAVVRKVINKPFNRYNKYKWR